MKKLLLILIISLLNSCCDCPTEIKRINKGIIKEKIAFPARNYDPVIHQYKTKNMYRLVTDSGNFSVCVTTFLRYKKGDTLYFNYKHKIHNEDCSYK